MRSPVSALALSLGLVLFPIIAAAEIRSVSSQPPAPTPPPNLPISFETPVPSSAGMPPTPTEVVVPVSRPQPTVAWDALAPGPVASPTPQALPPPRVLSAGSQDQAFALAFEQRLDHLLSAQVAADAYNNADYQSAGVGAGLRLYPGSGAPLGFSLGARLRIFEQNSRRSDWPGFYRGLRMGPEAGFQIQIIQGLTLAYRLSWVWDNVLYQSDPQRPIGEGWRGGLRLLDGGGFLTDAASLGWSF
jgi:hypothetical protein